MALTDAFEDALDAMLAAAPSAAATLTLTVSGSSVTSISALREEQEQAAREPDSADGALVDVGVRFYVKRSDVSSLLTGGTFRPGEATVSDGTYTYRLANVDDREGRGVIRLDCYRVQGYEHA